MNLLIPGPKLIWHSRCYTDFMMEAKMHVLKESSEMDGVMPGRMLPSFSVSDRELPEIKDWQVGKRYKLEIEVEQVSMTKNEYGKSPLMARLKIHKIGTKELLNEEEKKARKGIY